MDAMNVLAVLFTLSLTAVLIFSVIGIFRGEVKWKRHNILNDTIDSVSLNFQKKVENSSDSNSIHLKYSLSKIMPSHLELNKRVFSQLKEMLRQVELYVEKEKDGFSEKTDYPFIYTIIRSTGFFNEKDVLAMFSIANSSERNREVLKEVYHSILKHHSQDIPKSARSNLEFFRLIRTENHQLYKDFKAWIGAVVEADKVNDVELSRKDKVKVKMKEFIGVYEFKTDYSGENSFLSLPVEWQVDMILEHDEESQESITTL